MLRKTKSQRSLKVKLNSTLIVVQQWNVGFRIHKILRKYRYFWPAFLNVFDLQLSECLTSCVIDPLKGSKLGNPSVSWENTGSPRVYDRWFSDHLDLCPTIWIWFWSSDGRTPLWSHMTELWALGNRAAFTAVCSILWSCDHILQHFCQKRLPHPTVMDRLRYGPMSRTAYKQ